ncbi:hypothetical protein CEE39_01520 [bacterium (candidate division B38) B3_B38]|nr:MAG: hypothetical protein CEE39_01520 [bacterium (candidate division B38) B3_B38]
MRWNISCVLGVGLVRGLTLSQKLFPPAEAHSPWKDTLWQTVNFIILVAVLVYFLRKPVVKYLHRRSQKIKEDIDLARRDREEASAKLQEIKERLSRLDEELSAFKKGILQESQRERKRILSQAKQEAEELLKATTNKIESEVKLAKRRLQEYIAGLSVEEAERVLKGSLTDKDQEALIRKYLAKMEELQ